MIDDDEDDTNERRAQPDTMPERSEAREVGRDRKTLDEVFSDIDRDLSHDYLPTEAPSEPEPAPAEPRDPQSLPDEITKRPYSPAFRKQPATSSGIGPAADMLTR